MGRYYHYEKVRSEGKGTFDSIDKIKQNPEGYILCFFNGLFWTCPSATREDGSYENVIEDIWNRHNQGHYIDCQIYKVSPEFLSDENNRSS